MPFLMFFCLEIGPKQPQKPSKFIPSIFITAYCIQRLSSSNTCTDGSSPDHLLHWVTDTTITQKWQKCNCLTSFTISVSFINLKIGLPSSQCTEWIVNYVSCSLMQNIKRTQNHVFWTELHILHIFKLPKPKSINIDFTCKYNS